MSQNLNFMAIKHIRNNFHFAGWSSSGGLYKLIVSSIMQISILYCENKPESLLPELLCAAFLCDALFRFILIPQFLKVIVDFYFPPLIAFA